MRQVRWHRRLANLDGMPVPRVTGRVMTNDGLPLLRECFQLVHHGDAHKPALALLVHADLIAHQAGLLEIACYYHVFRQHERLPINQEDLISVDALHDAADHETSLAEMQAGVFDL